MEKENKFLKKIMNDFKTCDLCGKKKAIEHGVYKGMTFDLCEECSFEDLKKNGFFKEEGIY